MKRRLFKLAGSMLLGFALLEGLCSGLAWVRYGTLDVAEINELDIGNTYIADAPEGYAATLLPHPYLGYVRSSAHSGNNVGTIGADFPLHKDESQFTVLVCGGSVADQLCFTGALQESLRSDKPVRVLNGAGGAWKQPQQTIMAALYGDIADAVITIDGYNEMATTCLGGRRRFEAPGGNFAKINPILAGGYDRLGASWECNRLRSFSRAHNSRALFFATKVLRGRIESSAAVDAPDKQQDVFALPRNWSIAECRAYNRAEYSKYICLMHDMAAGTLAVKEAHFLQPCPGIGKPLTPDEKRVVGELDYASNYQHMVDELLKLNARGIPVVSLLDCFQGVDETIYADPIHCDQHGRGYRIMAERIAAELGRLWKPADSTASTK